MKTYTLYFEFFGRKMKTTVSADSCQDAKDQVVGRVNILSIYEELPPNPTTPNPSKGGEFQNSIFDLFKGFKK